MVSAYSYVRLSTGEQEKGDGQRRQLELCQAYACEHGLELRDEDLLKDIGRSGWTGENVTDGALGLFLQAVREKRVEPGSFLLVESWDRLSRQGVGPSLKILTDLFSSGIILVTIVDGQRYSQAAFGFMELLKGGLAMDLAHKESEKKSGYLSKAWKGKRESLALDKKLTSKCPGWLFPIHQDGHVVRFDLNEARVAVVRRIFEECAAGVGSYAIARRLNAEKIVPFGKPHKSKEDRPARAPIWNTSSITKIIQSRAAIGEFQPHRLIGGKKGKRVSEGDAIPGYFPSVVDDALFYRAQNARQQRRVGGGGRRGNFVSNLFSGIAECAYCGSTMTFENKGSGPKGGTYLVCSKARMKAGCLRSGWRYDDFETSFLTFVSELDLGIVLNKDGNDRARVKLDETLISLKGRRGELESERERVYELIKQPVITTTFIAEKLSLCEQQLQEVAAEIASIEAKLVEFKQEALAEREDRQLLKSAIGVLQNRSDPNTYILRANISARLKTIISRLQLASSGSSPNRANKGKQVAPQDTRTLILYLETVSKKPSRLRYYSVVFRDATVRAVFPDPADPSKFEHLYRLDGNTLNVEERTAEGIQLRTFSAGKWQDVAAEPNFPSEVPTQASN